MAPSISVATKIFRRNKTLPSKPAAKLFGRFHELGLMLCGFVLTTFLGGILTFWYQQQAWQRDDTARRKQDQFARASATFDELSKLIDRRIYRFRNVQGAMEANATPAEIHEMRMRYREVIAEWNENLNRNLVQMEFYFGNGAREFFEKSIIFRFADLHQGLIETIREPSPEKLAALKNNAEAMRPEIINFNYKLLQCLQVGAVGSFINFASHNLKESSESCSNSKNDSGWIGKKLNGSFSASNSVTTLKGRDKIPVHWQFIPSNGYFRRAEFFKPKTSKVFDESTNEFKIWQKNLKDHEMENIETDNEFKIAQNRTQNLPALNASGPFYSIPCYTNRQSKSSEPEKGLKIKEETRGANSPPTDRPLPASNSAGPFDTVRQMPRPEQPASDILKTAKDTSNTSLSVSDSSSPCKTSDPNPRN